MEFKDLLTKHHYYSSDTNYYSNEAGATWVTWQDFYQEYRSVDIDYNLIFRWDLKERCDDATGEKLSSYYMEIFIIHQRKGIYAPHSIRNVLESDFKSIKELLGKHWKYMTEIWNPISNSKLISGAPLLLDACKDFVAKVDKGEAKSVRSYAQMKEAINVATDWKIIDEGNEK